MSADMTAAQRELEGKYTVDATLGTGAGGETFEATDLRDGSKVALKRLGLATTRDWKAVELFQREARVLAGLNHPAIPRLRDSFVLETEAGPISYLAHDFAPGRSLRGWVESGWRADEAEVVRIGAFLLEVLGYLHGLAPAVIHRDIKPANVIRSENGQLWLVDFGAVRDATITMSGGSTVVGTYGYMAPEQFRGHAVFASDLYGVGATLLYLLTGRPPTELPQEKLKVSFRGQVHASERLLRWLDRALEPAPEDRFASAAAALAAMRGEADLGATAAAPGSPSLAKPAGPPTRSRRRIVALASVLAVLVVGGAGFFVVEQRARSQGTLLHIPSRPLKSLPPLPERPQSVFAPIRKSRGLQQEHTSLITALAPSSDGKHLASGSEGSAKLWDLERGTVERVLPGHEGDVRGAAFTTDDRRLVTGSANGVRIWDVKTGAQVTAITDVKNVMGVQITPDDKVLIVASQVGVLRLYDLAKREVLRSFDHHAPIQSMALAADGAKVATGGRDGSVKVWSVADGTVLASPAPHRGAIGAIAFSPDGRSLVTGADDFEVRLVHLATRLTPEKTFSWRHDDVIWGATFSNDGNLVYSTGREATINVASSIDGHIVAVVRDRSASKVLPVFSKDGGRLFIGGGRHVLVYPVARRGVGTTIPEPPAAPTTTPAPTPSKGRDYDLYVEAVRLIRSVPKISISEAEAKVQEALTASPSSPWAWLANARLAFSKAYIVGEQYEPAGLATTRKHLEHAATLGPKSPEWWAFSIWLCRAEKKPEAAREAVRQGYALAPKNLNVQFGELELDIDDQRYDKALAPLTRLIREQPLGDLEQNAYRLLSRVYTRLGDIDAADAAWRHLLAQDPQNAWTHGDYASFLLHDVGDTSRAIEEARAALAIMNYGVGRDHLARALTERGNAALWGEARTTEALRDYEEAIRVDPDTRDAYYGRAAVHRRRAIERQDYTGLAQARADLERVIASAPAWKIPKRALDDLTTLEAAAKEKK